LAGCEKSAGVKNAQEMQEDHEEKTVSTPAVDIPEQPPERNLVVQKQDGVIGPVRKRFVEELEQQA